MPGRLSPRADRHCQHCWGNCQGDCLLDEGGMCIHNADARMLRQLRSRRLQGRGLWRRLFRGGR